MMHHSHVTHHLRPKTSESEGDNYEEDGFEEASYDSEDQPNTSAKGSPEKPSVAGLDLASYMNQSGNAKVEAKSPAQNDLATFNIDTNVSTLEGIYPKTGDKDQILKRFNLGYTEAVTPKNVLQSSQSNQELRSSKVIVPAGSPVKQGLSWEEPVSTSKQATTPSHSDVDDQINAIYRKLELVQDKHDQQLAAAAAASAAMNGNKTNLSAINGGGGNSSNAVTQAENAARVDALLTELFPEKMEKIRGGKKKKQAYGLGAVKSHDIAHYINAQNHNQQPSKYQQGIGNSIADEVATATSATVTATSVNDANSPLSIEQQIKTLRKELKSKEEKLARVTEHSMMMAAHMDKLKGENALLAQKLHEAQMELEAKDARLAETLKQRKKSMKKAVQKENNDITSLENENSQLREREQALMDAVEELSIQNQDLILKLKESMQRELELSSKRAAMVSSTVANMTDGNHLPYINRAQYGGDMRSQSEPSDGVAAKKGAGGGGKKRK